MVVYLVKTVMKITKGVLSDPDNERQPAAEKPGLAHPAAPTAVGSATADVEKNRLFQTLEGEAPSERNYLKLLGIVAVAVIVAGLLISYLTLPGVGDEIHVSKDIEMALRDHFLMKEKRTATDVTFYQCDGYYGARVGVETRSDIQNPLFQIASYSARVTASDGTWTVTAQPVTSPEMDAPCR